MTNKNLSNSFTYLIFRVIVFIHSAMNNHKFSSITFIKSARSILHYSMSFSITTSRTNFHFIVFRKSKMKSCMINYTSIRFVFYMMDINIHTSVTIFTVSRQFHSIIFTKNFNFYSIKFRQYITHHILHVLIIFVMNAENNSTRNSFYKFTHCFINLSSNQKITCKFNFTRFISIKKRIHSLSTFAIIYISIISSNSNMMIFFFISTQLLCQLSIC